MPPDACVQSVSVTTFQWIANVGVVVLLVGRISDARHELEGGSEVACSYRPHQSTIGRLPGGQRGEATRDLSAGEQGSGGHGPILAGGVGAGQTVLPRHETDSAHAADHDPINRSVATARCVAWSSVKQRLHKTRSRTNSERRRLRTNL
jgi:hypothetical protein